VGGQEGLSRPLERISWETGIARCVLASQGEPGASRLSQGSSGHVGSHLSPFLAQQDISWGGAQRTAGTGCPQETKVLVVTYSHLSSQRSFPPSCSSPLLLFLPQPPSALSHPLLSHLAGDARPPGESHQPGRGAGLRVPRRQRELDGAAGFPPFLHRILRGPRKRLEVPLQGLHQWRRYSDILWSGHISPC